MIDTVFYYVDSYDEYEYRQQVGEIAPHTIVFVGDKKEIYKGGERYGIGDVGEIEQIITNVFSGESTPLKPATNDTIGGVIIKDGLLIDEDGNLKVDIETLIDTISKDPSILEVINNTINQSETVHGKDGATPEIHDGYWYINGQNTGVSATGQVGPTGPQGPAGKDGKDGNTPYIKDGYWFIDGQNTNVRAEGRDGKDGKDGKDGTNGSDGTSSGSNGGGSYDISDIENAIQDLQNRWNEINGTVEGVITNLFDNYEWVREHFPEGETTFYANYEEELKRYLQILGLWQEDENGNYQGFWSNLVQTVTSLKTLVQAIIGNANGNVEMWDATILSYIDIVDGLRTSVNQLGTTYAKKEAEDIIAWMYSGLTLASNETYTFNDLSSAAENGEMTALANIRTAVEKVNGDLLVSKSALESEVKGLVKGLIAAAGVLTSASLEEANSEIYAALDLHYAGIDVAVTKDENGQISSDVTIKGDLVNFESGNSRFKGSVYATDFLAGDKEGLNITTEGNKISFNFGKESRAYFTSEGLGMLLYIKNETGQWKKINFNVLFDASVAGTTNHIDLYIRTNNGFEYSRSIYYNTPGTYYSDLKGTWLTTSAMNSTYYVKSSKIGVVVYHSKQGVAPRNELHDCVVYKLVSFDDLGHMSELLSKYIIMTENNVCLWMLQDSNTISVSPSNIYFGNGGVKLSDVCSNPENEFNIKRMSWNESGTASTVQPFNGTAYGIKYSGNASQNYKPIFVSYTF